LLPLFATGVVYNGSKFATGVVDTGGNLACEYLLEFLQKFETVLLEYSEAGGKLIHEKTERKKSCDTVPLNSSNLNAIISTLIIINLN
jgi:hypothetical protein